MAVSSTWRRRLKRTAIALFIFVVVPCGVMLFLPVRLDFPINFIAARAMPASAGWRVRVDGATFRWRFGQDTAQI